MAAASMDAKASTQAVQAAINERKGTDDDFDADELFDSNCITPGTAFMDTLQSCIEYFVQFQLAHSGAWKSLMVIIHSIF